MLKVISIFLLLISFNSLAAVESGKIGQAKKIKTFLLVNHLPAFIGIVRRNWDNRLVGLTEDQKVELLAIKKRTLSNMASVVPQTKRLQNLIRENIMFGLDPESLEEDIDALAALKKRASMYQMRCVVEHIEVLTEDQVKLLLSY